MSVTDPQARELLRHAEVLFSPEQVQQAVKRVADEINIRGPVGLLRTRESAAGIDRCVARGRTVSKFAD